MTTHIEVLLKRAVEEQEEARQRFINACEWLARNVKDEAGRAKLGAVPSETVMSTSLVQDIQRTATEYRMLGETIRRLRELVDEDKSETGLTINNRPADLTDLAKLASDALRSSPGKWTCTCGRKNRGKDLVCDCGVTRESLVNTFGKPEEER